MSLPKFFSDFGKTVNDLLRPKGDEYNLKQPTVEVKLANGSPKTEITGTLKADNGSVALELKDKIQVETNTNLTVKVLSNKQPSLELENKSGLANGLDLTAKGQFSGAFSLNAKYKRESVAATTEFVVSDFQHNDISVKPSLVLGPFVDSRVVIGGSAVVKPSAKDALAEYELGVEYSAGSLIATGKVVEKGNKLKVGLSYAPSSKALFGTEYVHTPNGNAQQLAIATKYDFSNDTSVQTKVDSTGYVSTIFSQQVNNQVGLKLSSTFDATSLQKNTHRFGAKVTLGNL